MALNVALTLLGPRPVYAEGGGDIKTAGTYLKIPSADTPAEFAPGTWITPSTNGYIPVATGGAAASHYITKIFDAEGELLDNQYVAASPSVDYLVEAVPIGGVIFDMMEDGLVTPITDANAHGYADIVVGAITGTSAAKALFNNGVPSILINSDTVNASASGLLVQLLGVSPISDNRPYSATAAASRRIFRVKVIDAVAGARQ
jgi:hypothetical protein